MNKSETYAVQEAFYDNNEFWNSEEVKNFFGKTYSNVYQEQKYSWLNCDSTKFIKGYIINGKPYIKYLILEEGFEIFSPITIHSCLSNAPFNQVIDLDMFICILEKNWTNNYTNRQIFKDMHRNSEGTSVVCVTTDTIDAKPL